MASTSKCPYCDGLVKSDEKQCPHCGASNLNYVEDTERTILTPKTIEDLQEFCAERGMPLLRMRFFISEDFKEPRAFGIYRKENGDVVVYKNKDTGERAIRYEGPDEEHGVRELYLKLLDECHRRGIYPETPDGKKPADYSIRQEGQEKRDAGSFRFTAWFFSIMGLIGGTRNGYLLLTILCAVIILSLTIIAVYRNRHTEPFAERGVRVGIVAVLVIVLLISLSIANNEHNHPSGYYNVNNNIYYHLGSNWYLYDDTTYSWELTSEHADCDLNSYENSWNTDWGDTAYKFENTTTYSDYHESHDSTSSDYDSWDSGDTDWGSDW